MEEQLIYEMGADLLCPVCDCHKVSEMSLACGTTFNAVDGEVVYDHDTCEVFVDMLSKNPLAKCYYENLRGYKEMVYEQIAIAKRQTEAIKSLSALVEKQQRQLDWQHAQLKRTNPSEGADEFTAPFEAWVAHHAKLDGIEVRNGNEYPEEYIDKQYTIFLLECGYYQEETGELKLISPDIN